MKTWLFGAGRAVAMGLGWGSAWVPIAILIGLVVDRDGSMDEPWFLVGMYPGFLCGAVFSAMAGIASGRHGLDELSSRRAAAHGTASGLLVGFIWLMVAFSSDPPQWLLHAVVVGSLTLLSAVSGVAASVIARLRKNHATPRVA
jgi:hypothetical protein